jgi:SAM-dependent methyltransferase
MDRNFEEMYQTGDTPWDHGMVDFNLVETVSRHGIQPCKVLDIGCGTGDNAIWLARQGFDVVACDVSPTAIERAKLKAASSGFNGTFVAADFLSDPVPSAPFGFVFDRGCLHSISEEEGRRKFSANVASGLESSGLWLSLVGNADEPEREVGPPQLTAAELVTIVEPHFEILSLSSGLFGSDQIEPPRAWICLMRKRCS